MKKHPYARTLLAAVALISISTTPADAHKLRAKGETVKVADSEMSVTPTRDWNRLSQEPGKHAETWTLDGEQLDDLTFYGGIEPGDPLVKERSKKKDPLPKFEKTTLLVEIPELLEGTYRTYKQIGSFQLVTTEPTTFLGHKGVQFTYHYTDADQLTRKGEAKAAIIAGKLYMVTYDAPRLYYFDKLVGDVRALVATATL